MKNPRLWRSSKGTSCSWYRIFSYCTSSGKTGKRWRFGNITDYARDGYSALNCPECGCKSNGPLFPDKNQQNPQRELLSSCNPSAMPSTILLNNTNSNSLYKQATDMYINGIYKIEKWEDGRPVYSRLIDSGYKSIIRWSFKWKLHTQVFNNGFNVIEHYFKSSRSELIIIYSRELIYTFCQKIN